MLIRFLYTGWGPVVGLAGFFCVFITQIVVNAVKDDGQFYQSHDWPKLVGLAVAAALSFVIGHALNRRREDDHAEETSRYTNEHSLFLIPVQYWWIVYLLLGVLIVLT